MTGLFALLVVAMLPGLARLETDNSAAVFFLAGSGEVARYDAFVERFGSDTGLRIVVSGEGLFSSEGLAFLARLEEESARLDGVRNVTGPVGHHQAEGCLLYTSPSPRDGLLSRMPSSA